MTVRAYVVAIGMTLVGCGRIGFDPLAAPNGDAPFSDVIGELDPGFGGTGVFLYNYIDDDNVSKDDAATGVAIDGQGRIVASASGQFMFYAADDQIDMAAISLRLTAAGQLDATYQSGALSIPGVTTDSSGRFSHGEDVLVDAAGNVTMCGYREWSGTDDPTLYRYQAVGGQPDPTFGTGGLVQIPMGGEVRCLGIAVDPTDGNLVSTGEGEGAMIAAKSTSDSGAPVTTFATTGRLVFDVGGNDAGEDVVVDAQGRIYIVGHTTPATRDLTVWRYLPNGSLDAGFASGGILRYDGGSDDVGRDLALTPDGALIVVGTTTLAAVTRPVILRVTDAGELDPAFGDAGTVVAPQVGSANAVIVGPDGTITITGAIETGPAASGMAIWRLASTGTPIASFGSNGTLVTTTGADGTSHTGLALAIDAMGRIIVAGRSFSTTAGFYDAAIWRIR